MSKLLVTACHQHGPLPNGADGCHARWGNEGMCPGIQTAEWLNGLGDDDAKFANTTALVVRLNWLRNGHQHVVAIEPALAEARQREVSARRELDAAKKRVKQLSAEVQQRSTDVSQIAAQK